MAKAPAARFQSAMEFHEALTRAIAEAPHAGPIVAPAMERTEVMERPDFSQPSSAAPQPAGTKAPPRSHVAVLTLVAATVVAAGVWILTAGRGASSDAAHAASLENAPLTEARPLEPAALPAALLAAPVQRPRCTRAIDAAAGSRVRAFEAGPAGRVVQEREASDGDGSRTTTSDAALQFSEAEIRVQSSDAKVEATALRYPQVAKATYVHARDPKWDPLLSGPAGKVDVPGILGRARHWLVLQSKDAYVILRLDGEDRLDVLKAIEDRTGIVVERPVVK